MDIILGLETSCDETAAAVVVEGHKVLSNVVASQVSKHAIYGGVVPELAAREHIKAIQPVVSEALEKSGVGIDKITAISVTNGPGLMPALLVGINFARGLASSRKLPLFGIDHFVAHIYGAFLLNNFKLLAEEKMYPILALVVSGGHTALVLINKDKSAKIIGTTIDDAAGEALDKGAKLLGLGYPGGPIIDKLAKNGDPNKYLFPRSLTGRAGKALSEENRLNFSFSGLKTSLLYHINKNGKNGELKDQILYDTVASYQMAVIDVLCMKTISAAKFYNAKSVVLSGGVAQNNLLRVEMEKRLPKTVKFILTPKEFCGDNAAMIAGLGWHHYKNSKTSTYDLDAYCRLPDFSEVPFV